MSASKSQAILNALLHNDDFAREVLPYIKEEYFENKEEQLTFRTINDYSYKFGSPPAPEELYVEVGRRNEFGTEHTKKAFDDLFNEHLKDRYKMRQEWIRDVAEKYCKDRALYLSITEAIQSYEGEGKLSRDSIPDKIREALSVSFDSSVGHEYFADADKAHAAYNTKEDLVPFKLDIFNKITQGGVPTKTLNLFMGGTNTFKTGFLCDLAASYLYQGFDVLYVTLEMSEMKIRERIDANLTKLRIPEVRSLLKTHYLDKIKDIQEKTQGRLFIKEYPMTSANANHFRALLKELEIKKSFKPKIIIIDYVSICASIRVKDSSNLYSYNKSIVEELRGLAQETNTVMWSAIQTNRSGQDASDLSMANTSESHGVPMTADLLWGIINTEDLEEKGLIMIKQLKSRYDDKSKYRKVLLGVDRSRMTVYEVDSEIAERYKMNNPEYKDEDETSGTDIPVMDRGKTKTKSFNFNED